MDIMSQTQRRISLWLVDSILDLMLLVWCLLLMKLVMEILIRIRSLSVVLVSLSEDSYWYINFDHIEKRCKKEFLPICKGRRL